MKETTNRISRRRFIKTASAAGLGAALSPFAAGERGHAAAPAQAAEPAGVPTRPFGRSGIEVPILSLGGMFDIPTNQNMLKQAVRWGVTYWDTAHIYRTQRGGHWSIFSALS